jgi:hypothetical protein
MKINYSIVGVHEGQRRDAAVNPRFGLPEWGLLYARSRRLNSFPSNNTTFAFERNLRIPLDLLLWGMPLAARSPRHLAFPRNI